MYATEKHCNGILGGIYWLSTQGHCIVTTNDLKYIGLKIVYQKLYEFDSRHFVTPDYVYRFLNTVLFILLQRFKNQNKKILRYGDSP